jgi:glycosyltransferase involved in cell wall biosynthesis
VATVHGFTGGGFKNRVYEWFDRHLLCRFDAVACVSEALFKSMLALGMSEGRLRLVPNAPARSDRLSCSVARTTLGLPPSARVVGWIGRLSQEKAPEWFVQALGLVREPCIGVIVGDGPSRPDVERAASTLGARVRLVGAIPEAERIIPAFDVLVISSRTEGTPMVLLEAMDARVPVVSFSVGGVPKVLSGVGWLVRPGDVWGLADAISTVLAEPDEAKHRANAARVRVDERYAEPQWIDSYAALYAVAQSGRHTSDGPGRLARR